MYRRRQSLSDSLMPFGVGLIIIGVLVFIGYAIWWHINYKCVRSHREDDTCWHTIQTGDTTVSVPYSCKTTVCDEWVER